MATQGFHSDGFQAIGAAYEVAFDLTVASHGLGSLSIDTLYLGVLLTSAFPAKFRINGNSVIQVSQGQMLPVRILGSLNKLEVMGVGGSADCQWAPGVLV